MLKRVLWMGLLLALITGFSGFAIASVNNLTEDLIAEQLLAVKNRSLKEVYPGNGEIKDESSKYLNENSNSALVEVSVLYQAEELKGVIYTVETVGYNGLIRTLVAFDKDANKISGVKVLKQSETPGLGTNSSEKWFSKRFLDKAATTELQVTKSKPAQDNEIQAITSATITTTAIVDGVNLARQHFLENFSTTP